MPSLKNESVGFLSLLPSLLQQQHPEVEVVRKPTCKLRHNARVSSAFMLCHALPPAVAYTVAPVPELIGVLSWPAA